MVTSGYSTGYGKTRIYYYRYASGPSLNLPSHVLRNRIWPMAIAEFSLSGFGGVDQSKGREKRKFLLALETRGVLSFDKAF